LKSFWKTSTCATVLALALGSASARAEEPVATPSKPGPSLEVTVSTDFFYGYDINSTDSRHSHLEVAGGSNGDYQRFLQNFLNKNYDASLSDAQFIYGFNVRLSGLPVIMKENVLNTLYKEVDHAIHEQREILTPQIIQKVDMALDANPNFKLLPPAMQDQIRTKTIEGALAQLNSALKKASDQKKNVLKSRTEDIAVETSFQQVAIGLGRVFAGGQVVVFAQIGKFHPQMGPNIDEETHFTKAEEGGAFLYAARLTSVASTGAAGLTTIYHFSNGLSLRADVYAFHERDPFFTAQNAIAAEVTLPEHQYQQYRRFYQINSGAVRALLKGEKATVYLSGGSYNGHYGVGIGGTYQVTKKDLIQIDVAQTKRGTGSGQSVFWVHDLTPKINFFAGIENLKGIRLAAINPLNTMDMTRYITGMKYIVWGENTNDAKIIVFGQTLEGKSYVFVSPGFRDCRKNCTTGSNLDLSAGVGGTVRFHTPN
jgi:hypothetical protein